MTIIRNLAEYIYSEFEKEGLIKLSENRFMENSYFGEKQTSGEASPSNLDSTSYIKVLNIFAYSYYNLEFWRNSILHRMQKKLYDLMPNKKEVKWISDYFEFEYKIRTYSYFWGSLDYFKYNKAKISDGLNTEKINSNILFNEMI
ncbi:hypothetical protein EDEG_00889 [Edhazardia aedis USNM 41457]|uniref:Uncharacterized protein n=1 Tax=Edhazardia aedis (strain USNM 41457) TaxID=1003232 RepID=J9DBY7_EDHAE|nr:hypothetical protein EDEG_00889 [Edhazardia aedis USNM 41457]|eukprot:EJW05009.1 hypothetical protein EDEG_00889 [Edhazardia aedis USNM 41457]